jgi:hypothetical protein
MQKALVNTQDGSDNQDASFRDISNELPEAFRAAPAHNVQAVGKNQNYLRSLAE